jgi:hypothetical protein
MKHDVTVAIFSFTLHQDLLPYAIKSVKKHLPNSNIVVVWDDFLRDRPINFDEIKEQTNCDFRVVKHTEIYDWPEAIGRWGWIRQQLAKLLCYTYINTPYTWIFDGDVYLTGDPELFDNGVPYLRYHQGTDIDTGFKEFMDNYYDFKTFNKDSFVGSTCLFDHNVLEEMFRVCENRNGKNLIECVNETLLSDNCHNLPFSEFETYGHFIINNCPDKFSLATRNWRYEPGQDTITTNVPIHIMWAEDQDPAEAEKKWLTQV